MASAAPGAPSSVVKGKRKSEWEDQNFKMAMPHVHCLEHRIEFPTIGHVYLLTWQPPR